MRLRTPGAKSEITYLVITNCPTRYILCAAVKKLGTALGMGALPQAAWASSRRSDAAARAASIAA